MSSPTYADYEKKMWGMARLGAIGDGGANTATGDPIHISFTDLF